MSVFRGAITGRSSKRIQRAAAFLFRAAIKRRSRRWCRQALNARDRDLPRGSFQPLQPCSSGGEERRCSLPEPRTYQGQGRLQAAPRLKTALCGPIIAGLPDSNAIELHLFQAHVGLRIELASQLR